MEDTHRPNRAHADTTVQLELNPPCPSGLNEGDTPIADRPRAPESRDKPRLSKESSPQNPAASDTRGIAVIVVAVVGLLGTHALVGRFRGGEVELRRLPEHQFEFRLDVNAANEIELQHLPGIGPKLAARIVEDRTIHGPFESIENIQRVKGIGPKTLENIRPYLRNPRQTDGRSNPKSQ